MDTNKARIDEVLKKHGLTVESVFVPFSQSRNKDEKNPSLNWKVTLLHKGRKIVTTDYMAGCGHAPSYSQPGYNTLDGRKGVNYECEHGKEFAGSKRLIKPDSRDVIWSLLMDSDVLNYGDFESWAGDFGYDPDSRKAERTYNDCMRIALKVRAIGESVIEELRDAYQDY